MIRYFSSSNTFHLFQKLIIELHAINLRYLHIFFIRYTM